MPHCFIEAVCRTPDRISAYSVRLQVSNRNLHSRNTLRVLQRRSLNKIFRCFAHRRKGIPMPHSPLYSARRQVFPGGCSRYPSDSSCRRRPKPGFCYPGASEYPQARASFAHIDGTGQYRGCRGGYRRSVPVLSRKTRVNPLGSLH